MATTIRDEALVHRHGRLLALDAEPTALLWLGTTPAVALGGLVRLMHEVRGLLVIDDLERIGSGGAAAFGEISQMLKIGYKQASGWKPVVDRSGNVLTLDFYGPKAVTNTSGVEPILESRMLRIETACASDAGSQVPELSGPDGVRAQSLRDELHSWRMARAVDVQSLSQFQWT